LVFRKLDAEEDFSSFERYLKLSSKDKDALMSRMEPFMFEWAQRVGTVASYEKYMEYYPEGAHLKDAQAALDPLVFRKLDAEEDFSSFERYLELSSKDKDALMSRMEPFMFEWAQRVGTVESYEKYLEYYPEGAHLKDAQAAMDPALFKKAQEEDWYSAYEKYIEKFPNGADVPKAKERIEWLKANKAVVEIDYPGELEQTSSPYSNVSSPFWAWDTVFKETGGKVGFRLSGSGYILDPKGGRWVSEYGNCISRGEISVPAGGTESDSYWHASGGHERCNGYAVFTWAGEDAGGHHLEFEVKVHCTHAGCPGTNQ